MEVCIIAEGCYPYITGGVSAWIHQLVTGLPEIEFKIVSIMPSHREQLTYRYKFPENVTDVTTYFLDDYATLRHANFIKKVSVNNREKDSLSKLLKLDQEVDWKEIIRLVSKEKKTGSAVEFLQSEFFWNAVVQLYQEKFEGESFNTFFWTIRTMLLPFIHLLQREVVSADIYHSVSTGYAGVLGVYYREITQKPFLLTEHGIYAREREEEIIKANWVTGIYKKLWIDFFYSISCAAYKEADKIISLFERNRTIQRELGASEERTYIISNGVDMKRFNVERKAHSGFNIGAILRIVPIKDVMTLIRAFKIIREKIDSVKLHLIGPYDEDPEYYQQCVSLIELLELGNDVIFTGSVDTREYMPIIDVLVLTSISEGQPLVVLEGMAAGIPVVSTNVGSCKELLEKNNYEGPCGLITNLVSPNDTAAQIITLLENPDTRTEMGKNGRRRVERAYSKGIFLDKYRAIYKDLYKDL